MPDPFSLLKGAHNSFTGFTGNRNRIALSVLGWKEVPAIVGDPIFRDDVEPGQTIIACTLSVEVSLDYLPTKPPTHDKATPSKARYEGKEYRVTTVQSQVGVGWLLGLTAP